MKSEREYEEMRRELLAKLLERKVVANLRSCLGKVLETVRYRCIPGECQPDDVHDPDLFIGGEIVLGFSGSGYLTVTWDEGAGWDDTFSIQARAASSFRAGSLLEIDGSEVALWKEHIGSPLGEARVHGYSGVPHVIELVFPGGSVVLADSSENSGPDGDDLIARPGSHLASLAGLERLVTAIAEVKPAPENIGTETVLAWTVLPEPVELSGCGRTVTGLAICGPGDAEYVFLFGCDAGWSSITDSWHQTMQEALEQAELEHPGVSGTWRGTES